MAEGIANGMFGNALNASSAGSKPKPPPHHRAIELLTNHSVPIDTLRSKSWDEFSGARFDAVITLCDSAARDECPIFRGAPISSHWSLPDPAGAGDEALIFQQTFEILVEAIQVLANRPGELRDRLEEAKTHVGKRVATIRVGAAE